jgi:hypothetical protein
MNPVVSLFPYMMQMLGGTNKTRHGIIPKTNSTARARNNGSEE